MSFGDKLLPFWGKAGPALGQKFLIKQAALPATTQFYDNGDVETANGYTVISHGFHGLVSLVGGGFLFHWGVMDYSGGYVIHLSSGIAGLTAAFWVSPPPPPPPPPSSSSLPPSKSL
ncbi:hypothetical protein NC652_040399 [Populus alba x Populus x berolinensis]|nr:hypothetical protein NC652_040399 [Populus alba x Populus x berolinensis]